MKVINIHLKEYRMEDMDWWFGLLDHPTSQLEPISFLSMELPEGKSVSWW
jgi:hypothetical protein